MRKFLRKYHQVQRCTCAFLVLYLIHAFAITSLVAAPSPQASTVNITDITTVDHEAQKQAPKKNKNKPYSLFIAKHGVSKITRSSETIPAQIATAIETVLPLSSEKITFSTSTISASSLNDDAYKRYCRLRVFLI